MDNKNKEVGNGNLIPFNEQTEEEQREKARKGGIASGEARRKKKAMKEAINTLLSLPLKDEKAKLYLEFLGFTEEEMDNQLGLVVAMFKQAVAKGDVQAANWIRDTGGEKPVEKVKNEVSGNINNPFDGLTTEELKQMINND